MTPHVLTETRCHLNNTTQNKTILISACSSPVTLTIMYNMYLINDNYYFIERMLICIRLI